MPIRSFKEVDEKLKDYWKLENEINKLKEKQAAIRDEIKNFILKKKRNSYKTIVSNIPTSVVYSTFEREDIDKQKLKESIDVTPFIKRNTVKTFKIMKVNSI